MLGAVDFFGCPGPRMRSQGVAATIDQSKLSVVGLAEVVTHLPAIHREYRKLIAAAKRERPDVAILTDSSGFHLRVAKALRALSIPVVYLVAPQAWAWRKGRVHDLRRNVARLLCIFPFEEKFFRSYGVPATYIGHPLARLIAPSRDRAAFFAESGFDLRRPLVALLPGSRVGEISRHLPLLEGVVTAIRSRMPEVQFALGSPLGLETTFIEKGIGEGKVKILSGATWDLLAHCDLALAASGTVTIEAALLGAPMATFYRVSALTWWIGRSMVNVPFYSMVNLVAGRKMVPELIQDQASPERLAAEAISLLEDGARREAMRRELADVRAALATEGDPLDRAADQVLEVMDEYANR